MFIPAESPRFNLTIEEVLGSKGVLILNTLGAGINAYRQAWAQFESTREELGGLGLELAQPVNPAPLLLFPGESNTLRGGLRAVIPSGTISEVILTPASTHGRYCEEPAIGGYCFQDFRLTDRIGTPEDIVALLTYAQQGLLTQAHDRARAIMRQEPLVLH